MKKIICLSFVFIFFTSAYIVYAEEPIENDINIEEEQYYPYPKLDDLMKELKEKRKLIEQQRLEEIKAKKEAEQIEKGLDPEEEVKEDEKKKESTKEDEKIPSLIVRLRGKHSNKYLCAYDFLIYDETRETELSKEIINSADMLLKKPSLKVRVGESINFEFSEEPKEVEVYIWDEKMERLPLTRGTMKVPDMEKKIVVIVKGNYKNGWVKYAVILDIRK